MAELSLLVTAFAALYLSAMIVPWILKSYGIPGGDALMAFTHRLMMLPFRLGVHLIRRLWEARR
jgi:hypothetical protein